MDEGVLAILTVGSVGLLGLGFARRGRTGRPFAIFPFLGGLIGIFSFAGLGVDGNVTQVSGGNTITILSASTTSFTWEAILLLVLFFSIGEFVIAAYKGVGGI